jgi:hypothetical protein
VKINLKAIVSLLAQKKLVLKSWPQPLTLSHTAVS